MSELSIIALSKSVDELEQLRRSLLQWKPISIAVYGEPVITAANYEAQIRDILLKMTGEQLDEAVAALKEKVEML